MRYRLAGCAAALLLTALSTVFAAPASAAGPTIRLDSPDASAPLTDHKIHVQGQASMPSGGTVNNQLTIEVTSLDGRGGNSLILNVNGNPVPFSWDYMTAYNGRYEVKVSAYGRDPGPFDSSPAERSVLTRVVEMAVKPAVPTGVKATTTKAREVEVKWNPNSEPDLLGYQIQRMHEDDADWQPAGNTHTLSFIDTFPATKGGEYRYRVFALRAGAVQGQGVASDPSPEQQVEVADPPATTSTTSSGGISSGSGTNGGSGTSGGGTGTAGGSGSTGAGGGTQLAQAGKVDLSGFAGLLNSATSNGTRPAARPGEEDGGFADRLPFKPGEEVEELGEDGTALGIGIEEAGSEEGRKPIAFVAASLLVTVILMHVLWLKREVDKAGLLEAAPTEG